MTKQTLLEKAMREEKIELGLLKAKLKTAEENFKFYGDYMMKDDITDEQYDRAVALHRKYFVDCLDCKERIREIEKGGL